ncbi:MAG: O-antigen ligase family protein [bacterium]|nr:O-antigen ligase family protein [bacterium]
MNRVNRVCDFIILLGLFIYALAATTSISAITIGVVLSVLGWIGRIVLTKRFEIKNMPLNLPIFVFLGILLLSTAMSQVPLGQRLDSLHPILERILPYFLVIYGIKEKKQIKWLLVCLIGSLSIFSGFKMIQFILDPETNQKFLSNRALGECLGMVIPLTIAMFFCNFSRKIKGLLIFSIAIMVFCLVINGTRGAWVGSILALCYLAIFLSRKLFFGLGIFIFLLFSYQIERASTIFDSQDSSNLYRVYQCKAAILMIKERPLLGYGPGSFQKFWQDHMSEKIKERFGRSHKYVLNMYLQIAGETGVLCIFAFFWLIIASFRLGWNLVQKQEEFRILLLGILACIVDFLVHGMVNHTLYGKSGYLFWFYLGIISWVGFSNKFRNTLLI